MARRIAINPILPLTGGVLASASFLLLIWHSWEHNPHGLLWLAGFYAVSGALEGWLVLRKGPRAVRNPAQ
jgi:hypothetical protein